MKANKVTLTVEIEVLHIDAAPTLLMKVANEISDEFTSGELTADDGDTARWSHKTEAVEF